MDDAGRIHSALLLLPPIACALFQEAQPCRLVLPDGPEAKTLALVDPSAPAASLPPLSGGGPGRPDDWPRVSDRWSSWAEWLSAEAASEYPTPSRRAGLALIALGQGRRRDAWNHFAATSADPPSSAALLPAFLPGIDVAQLPAGAGGMPPPLPDGVLLRPTTPPIPDNAQFITDWRREMSISGFRVGEATLSMRVALDYEGIQVDLTHIEGGAARVQVELPAPSEFVIGAAYLDWFPWKGPTSSLPLIIDVELQRGSEVRTLFGRFEPREPSWSQQLPAEIPRSIGSHGLLVLAPLELPEELRGLDGALARLLGVECKFLPGTMQPPATLGPATTIDLRSSESRAHRLAALASQVERFVLSRP